MKIVKLLMVALFVLSSVVCLQAGTNTLVELESYAKKMVPPGFKNINADEDERSASMAFQKGETVLQLTLSPDRDSQMPIEEKMKIGGKPAQFFRPMGEGSGGLFIMIEENKSLAILYMTGFMSDKEVTVEDMKKMTKELAFH